MSIYYSKSAQGFYCTEIHGENIPNDVVEITKEYHRELFDGVRRGKVIRSDDRGYPILKEPDSALPEILLEECRSIAKSKLQASDWTQLVDVNLENKSEFAAYRKQLRDLFSSPVEDPVWPTLPDPIWIK